MKKIIYLLLFLMVSILLLGCGAAGEVPSLDSNESSVSGSNEGLVVETTRKIYYTVDMYIDSDDVELAYKYYTSKLSSYNGYVSSSTINSTGSSYVVYKVPTEKLTEFLDYIEIGEQGEVVRKSITTTDITSKYNAVTARLDVLNASRQSYLKMLEKANSLSETISLQNKIEDIDTEIKRLENEKSSYDSLLEYSTITIYFNQKIKESFFGDYFGFVGGFFRVVGMIILYTLPFGILALAVLALIFAIRKITRGKKNEKEKKIV